MQKLRRTPSIINFLIAVPAVPRDENETQKRQDVAEIHAGQAADDVFHAAGIDNRALQRRKNRTAHDGHDEEGRTERRILGRDVFKRDAVDGREHERHEKTDGNQAVKSRHAVDEDCAQCRTRRTHTEARQQQSAIKVTHQERRNKTCRKEEAHGHDVVVLGRCLAHAQTLGILDDEGPDHNLRCDVEDLRQHALAIDRIVPQTAQGFLGRYLFMTARCVWHLGQCDDNQNHQHNDADTDVWVADDGEVVHTNVGLLRIAQRVKEDFSRIAATVAPKVRQHNLARHRHAAQGTHRVERLRQVQTARRGRFCAQ